MSLSFQSLTELVQILFNKKIIRPIDLQFAKFVASLEPQYSDEVTWLAALTSAHFGQGHICLQLENQGEFALPSAKLMGIYGEAAKAIDNKIASIDWLAVMASSQVISCLEPTQHVQADKPLMWQNGRLYLQRYCFYEQSIASQILAMAQPIEMDAEQVATIAEQLNQLFKRRYDLLYAAIVDNIASGGSAVSRQQLVCDQLDVIQADSIHWGEVEHLIGQANIEQALQPLEQLIPQSACFNWQKVAAAVALTRRFAVISGGPGTGKTTTVAKLLSALVYQSNQVGRQPVINLVAPTGKAAARLTESIGQAVGELPITDDIRKQIPTQSSTIHRLLGAIPGRVGFRHDKDNPLHLDVLVLDEASMVDLPMMYRLLDALPSHARLILLGDKDQLASVEAGAVLSDICQFATEGYSNAQSRMIANLTGHDSNKLTDWQPTQPHSAIADSLCVLQKSYRFDARSGIGQLAKQVNRGNSTQAMNVWDKGFADIEWQALSGDSYTTLITRLADEYRHYLTLARQPQRDVIDQYQMDKLAHEALQNFAQSRLLCALREGDFGVVGLNQRIEQRLQRVGQISVDKDKEWYIGRPVMVTRNDAALGVFNGDIGLCLQDQTTAESKLKIYFELPDGSIKAILPSRMPEHETAYAMTIHKSQGSEFSHTYLVLPTDISPIVTKELIYTGITRAKKRLTLVAETGVFTKSIRQQTIRHSGLGIRLQS
ncbi:exodeoxyribonuclease V subunit alpha [Vibrio hippocampi]|uniref:RecBCD enzyme subunit RecD n=1 Tax=Vibrio hippocampi TaxID=654686 RepID=A0ABM8ZJJ5_9VIBR|nr:exodeoxyribonuclease V subunit alpha [Vibrio hippocampi]CAH0526740.1 RecBCD enzyme subunit RecD [Vibrio hippocampi]